MRAGEIVGVAALEGQGQDALFDYLAGERRPRAARSSSTASRSSRATPTTRSATGMVLVPADRMMALLPQRPIRENIAAPLYNRISRWGPINGRDERQRVQNAIEKLQIDTRAQRQARRLSGGNQQKLTIARWLAAGFQVMLCFDPTRGIDVGTKRQIYVLLRELAEAGAAILLFTSELPEIQLVCDRTIVVYRGAVTGRCRRRRPTRRRCCGPRTGSSSGRRRHEDGRRSGRPTAARAPTGAGSAAATAGRSASTSCSSLLIVAYNWAPRRRFTSFDFQSLVLAALPLAFAAMAQSVIIISGGIDLSVGVMALTNCIAAKLMEATGSARRS